MVTLACASPLAPDRDPDARFLPSDLDAPHRDGSPNYTVDTLTRLAAEHPGAALFTLIGADNFASLATWCAPHRLLELSDWIVISRPAFKLMMEPQGLTLTAAQLSRIHRLDTVHEDVSATVLRQRLHSGQGVDTLIPPAVLAYIRTHHLYT